MLFCGLGNTCAWQVPHSAKTAVVQCIAATVRALAGQASELGERVGTAVKRNDIGSAVMNSFFPIFDSFHEELSVAVVVERYVTDIWNPFVTVGEDVLLGICLQVVFG